MTLSAKIFRATPLLMVVALLALSSACAPSAGDKSQATDASPCRDGFLESGDSAPTLELLGMDGQPATVGSLTEGKVALVDFWATWCAPCIAAMPHLEALYQKHKDDGFVVVGVMSDSNATRIASEHVPGLGVSYPMLLDDDSEVSACHWGQIIGYPTVVLLDRDGTVVEVFVGTGDVSSIERAVGSMFAESELAASDAATQS